MLNHATKISDSLSIEPDDRYAKITRFILDALEITSGYTVKAEWLQGGEKWISNVTSLKRAKAEAELWADEYEAQR